MSTKATTPRTPTSRAGKLMTTLFAAQVCGSTGHSIGMAIGGIMAAGITGTNTWSGMPVAVGSLGTALEASAFLISVAGYAVAALLVELFLRPDPLAVARQLHESVASGRPAEPARGLGEILGDVHVQLALATLTISQFVMISTTSTSPVHLHDHGHTVQTIGLAVSLHLGGMYVASPLSGWLCDRLGRLPMIGVGALVLTGAVLLAGLAPGSDRTLVILGLFLNGVGWNFAFVAGSALLTDALSPAERASTQGLADLFMGLMGAFGSAAGGMILGVWGFTVLNTLGARPRTARRDVTAPPRPLPHLAGWQAAEKGASA